MRQGIWQKLYRYPSNGLKTTNLKAEVRGSAVASLLPLLPAIEEPALTEVSLLFASM